MKWQLANPHARCAHSGATRPLWATVLFTAVLIGLLAVVACAAQKKDGAAGDEGEKEPKKAKLGLMEREPFDRITLDAENDNMELDVLPVEKVPSSPKPAQRLRIRLVEEPKQLYEVEWRHIVKFRTYAQLVFDEARKLVNAKKYNEAFPYFSYLLEHSKVTHGLRKAVLEYLLDNATELVKRKQFDHALAILEVLTERDPDYRRAEVAATLARVADQLIADYVQRGDFRKARGVIARLKKQYGTLRIESLDRWKQKLIDQTTRLKQQATRQLAAGKLREAEQLGRRMIAVWPDLAGAAELNAEIARKYPMVIVGVGEVSTFDDVASIDNWAARRTGALTQRTLMEFKGAGPEGGQYSCSLGEYAQSDDRRQLILELNPEAPGGAHVTGYDVSRRVLNMADPRAREYQPTWAALVKGARVEDVFRVRIDLRRPHVLPEAMLQIRIDPLVRPNEVSPSAGPYLRVADTKEGDQDTHFLLNARFPFGKERPPSEIVERYFEKSQDAISALRRGDIDAIDYLFPADAALFKNDKSLTVEAYSLPTIHVLIPSNTNPFTANQTFRRALVYGINRQAILEGELLGQNEMPGCEVISGPFPIGTRDNDPLAYAYDDHIVPRSFYPRLAIILRILARRELKEIANRRDEEVPELRPLVLGFPSNEVARVACQAIAQYLEVIGIKCKLRELPAGMTLDSTGEVDLLYMQVAMWEPIIDARRLLAPAGVAAVGNEYVGMALRRLDAAKNWREARDRLHELHRIVHEQVAVVPLWQTVNHLVYSRRLRGVTKQPLTFYQHVQQWKTSPGAAPKQAAQQK